VQVDGSHHVPEQCYAADDYWGDLEAARQRERTWNQKRVQLLRHYIQGITEANILDYGSGHGGFLEAGTPIFRNLLGFDLNKRVCQAHRASGWRCINSPKEIPHDIEVILLFHVIEHLPKP
jgi:2-polyprenyl-3-methyl-5-hydroxy-6-metoxy-1,4-benzoquinol methylase